MVSNARNQLGTYVRDRRTRLTLRHSGSAVAGGAPGAATGGGGKPHEHQPDVVPPGWSRAAVVRHRQTCSTASPRA